MLPEPGNLRILRSEDGALPFGALDLSATDIQARFAWAISRGHPSYLWPELPRRVWQACLSEIERVSGLILAGTTGVRLEPPAEGSARSMGIAGFTSGMGPLLAHWLEQRVLQAGPELGQLLELHLRHARVHAQRRLRTLEEALILLAGAGIPVTVIKGSHARAYFPEPALRPAADIDIVIPRIELSRAAAILSSAGYTPSGSTSAPKCEWWPPGLEPNPRSLELLHGESGYAIDVHDSLDRNFDGIRMVRLGAVDALAEPWPEQGARARRLTPVANAALLALHMSDEWHRLQLIRVVELVLVLRRDFASGSPNWRSLRALLDTNRAQRFVYPAFELVERLAPGTVDPGFRHWLAPHAHPRLIRVVDRLRPADQRSERTTPDEVLIWADGFAETARRLLDLAWPSRSRKKHRSIRAIYRERLVRIIKRTLQ